MATILKIKEKRKLISKKINHLSDKKLSSLMQFIETLEQDVSEIKTHFASESVLAKEWNTKEEDEAWQDL